MLKRITVLLPENVYENLRARTFTSKSGGVSETIRTILTEIFDKEDTLAHKVVEQPLVEVPFKSLKESKQEIEEIERDESSEKPVGELPPMCEMGKCTRRSDGHFKVITNDGTNEMVKYLCVFHLAMARREGEVQEL